MARWPLRFCIACCLPACQDRTKSMSFYYWDAASTFSYGESLFEINSDVNPHTNHHIRNLIFFDPDRQNLLRYDRNIFKEALACIK